MQFSFSWCNTSWPTDPAGSVAVLRMDPGMVTTTVDLVVHRRTTSDQAVKAAVSDLVVKVVATVIDMVTVVAGARVALGDRTAEAMATVAVEDPGVDQMAAVMEMARRSQTMIGIVL